MSFVFMKRLKFGDTRTVVVSTSDTRELALVVV
jgi:hypothetical protein